MTVLVTGIRGSIAGRVADTLHAGGHDVRGTSASGQIDGLAFPVVGADLSDSAALAAALEGVDRVLLYAPEKLGDLTATLRASSVEQVVLISSASLGDPRLDAIADHHRQAEDAVRGFGGRWTFLRPDVFARNSLAWSGELASGRLSIPYPDAYVEPIHEDDIADAAVAALTGTSLDGRELIMTGPQSLTHREQVATIGAALGLDVTVDALDPAGWREQVSQWMPAAAADALLGLWADSASPRAVEHTLREITGAAPRSYAQWVDDNLAAFSR